MSSTARVVTLALAGLLFAVVTGPAHGGALDYRLTIDGVLADEHKLMPGSTFTVAIEARCPGGESVAQYAVNLLDSSGTGVGSALVPKDKDMNGLWDSQLFSPLNLNVAGRVSVSGYDVFAQTGSVVPYGNTGLGSGVWSVVGSGDFLYSGGTATLTVVPYDLSGQRIWSGGGAVAPTGAASYVTTITPEPATLALLVAGGLGVLLRRRK